MRLSGNMLMHRANEARVHYSRCELCEHRCGVNRAADQRGPCLAGPQPRVYRHRVEYGEELELIPSHLFYLSGCDLRCAFCIAEEDAFDPRRGGLLSAEWLAETIAWGQTRGARNIQWVGGEPTIHLPGILEAMGGVGTLPPIVWKSDFYGTAEAFRLLEGVVDVYVADFKFGNDSCARRIAGVNNYMRAVARNLAIAAAQAELIVRHLLLPGHFECCFRPIVDWMARQLPAAKFSLRGGYLPKWRAGRHQELRQPLARQEASWARAWAEQAGLRLVD